jgi:hypothetical protein
MFYNIPPSIDNNSDPMIRIMEPPILDEICENGISSILSAAERRVDRWRRFLWYATKLFAMPVASSLCTHFSPFQPPFQGEKGGERASLDCSTRKEEK